MLKLVSRFLDAGLLPGMVVAVFGINMQGWQPAKELNLGSVDIRPNLESAWVRALVSDDPATQSIVSSYVSSLAAAGYQADRQGVWVASGQFPMAQYQGDVRRSAASLTKIATTLAALSSWGPERRFETLVGWNGTLENGVVVGDLVIEGGDDPLFVWEEAIALGNALQALGVRQVTGDLVIAGSFTMNFETSPTKSGQLLKQAFDSATWDYAAEIAYQTLPPGTSVPTIQIGGQVRADSNSWKDQVSGWLVRHQSLPLVAVLKAMNIYSNNAMAEQIAHTLGGPSAVVQKAEEAAGVLPGELALINGSGLGEANQMSPRAAVTMLQKIQDELRAEDYTISDIFPVAGADGGTVTDRAIPSNAVVKTGTLAVVSALAGAMPTRDKGIVWFSVINYGNGLDSLRVQQDKVIAAVEQQWGRAAEIPPELRTRVRIGQAPYQIGDGQRNQSMLNSPAQN
ncbi:MAG: D-alanyl-D-alanine carboxypeptidase [Phormidesmis sp.]